MRDDSPTKNANRRHDERVSMGETVTITFATDKLVGPGKNISPQGVFFVTETAIPVRVRVKGLDTELDGELVRVQSMGEGLLGIAVRFVGDVPELPELPAD